MSEFQTPWKAVPITESCDSCYMIIDARGNTVSCDLESKGHAERIVAAVNNHERLVSKLQSFIRMPADRWGDIEVLQFKAQTLLAEIDKESAHV